MQEHIIIMTPVYATHNKWHTCKSTLPSRVQYMPPTTSDIYARAYRHVSSTCHPRWVACMQEHSVQNLDWTIPWSILQGDRKTQGPPLVSPTDSHHHASSTCHFIKGTYACKTQGPPLVHTSTKPKASPWSAHIQQLWRPSSKIQVQQEELPPHYLARLLIGSKPHLLLITIRRVTLQVKMTHHQIAWQDLQSGVAYTHSS